MTLALHPYGSATNHHPLLCAEPRRPSAKMVRHAPETRRRRWRQVDGERRGDVFGASVPFVLIMAYMAI